MNELFAQLEDLQEERRLWKQHHTIRTVALKEVMAILGTEVLCSGVEPHPWLYRVSKDGKLEKASVETAVTYAMINELPDNAEFTEIPITAGRLIAIFPNIIQSFKRLVKLYRDAAVYSDALIGAYEALQVSKVEEQ